MSSHLVLRIWSPQLLHFTIYQESDQYSTVKSAIYLNVWLKCATVAWCTIASKQADLLFSMLTVPNHYRLNKHDRRCAIRSHQVMINPVPTHPKFFVYLLYSPMIVVPVSPQADTCLRPPSCRTSRWVWFYWQARWQSSAPVCCF